MHTGVTTELGHTRARMHTAQLRIYILTRNTPTAARRAHTQARPRRRSSVALHTRQECAAPKQKHFV